MQSLVKAGLLCPCGTYSTLLGSVGIPDVMGIEAGVSSVSLVRADLLGDKQACRVQEQARQSAMSTGKGTHWKGNGFVISFLFHFVLLSLRSLLGILLLFGLVWFGFGGFFVFVFTLDPDCYLSSWSTPPTIPPFSPLPFSSKRVELPSLFPSP